jgi:hypothetical protein
VVGSEVLNTCTVDGVLGFIFIHRLPAPGFQGLPSRRGPMVEQAVQTLPMASAAQKRAQPANQPQARQPVRPSPRPGRDGPQPLRRNAPSSKLTSFLSSLYPAYEQKSKLAYWVKGLYSATWLVLSHFRILPIVMSHSRWFIGTSATQVEHLNI